MLLAELSGMVAGRAAKEAATWLGAHSVAGGVWVDGDTGAVRVGRPWVLRLREQREAASKGGWRAGLRLSAVALSVLGFLGPGKDRAAVAGTCRVWAAAARHPALHLYVKSATIGGGSGSNGGGSPRRRGGRVFGSVPAALRAAKDGDTVVL